MRDIDATHDRDRRWNWSPMVSRRRSDDAGTQAFRFRADRSAAPSQGQRAAGRRARGDPGARRPGLSPAHHRQRQADPDQMTARSSASRDPLRVPMPCARLALCSSLEPAGARVALLGTSALGVARGRDSRPHPPPTHDRHRCGRSPGAHLRRLAHPGDRRRRHRDRLRAGRRRPRRRPSMPPASSRRSALKEKKNVGYMRALSTRGRASRSMPP